MKAHLSSRRRRLVLGLVVGVACLGGVARFSAPTPLVASATPAVLATAARHLSTFADGNDLHATYTLRQQALGTKSIDVWARLDGQGHPNPSAITIRDQQGVIIERMITANDEATAYFPAQNVIQQARIADAVPDPLDVGGLKQFVQPGQNGDVQTKLMGTQFVQGHKTDIVTVSSTQSQLTLYYDHDAGIVRRQEATDPSGHMSYMFELQNLEAVTPTAVAAGTYDLNAPATARLVTTPDGSPHLGTKQVSVMQWVAYPNRPHLILQGDPRGLILHTAVYTGYEHQALVFADYGSGGKAFTVSMQTTDHGLPNASDLFGGFTKPTSGAQNIRTLSTSIAGTMAQGTYYDLPVLDSPNPYRVLDVALGQARIRLTGRGMTQQEFLDTLGALVDGSMHPDVVLHLQGELDAARSTPR